MAKGRVYPPEFRHQMVYLVMKAGRTPRDLERKFEPSARTIWNWVEQAQRDAGASAGGSTTAQQDRI